MLERPSRLLSSASRPLTRNIGVPVTPPATAASTPAFNADWVAASFMQVCNSAAGRPAFAAPFIQPDVGVAAGAQGRLTVHQRLGHVEIGLRDRAARHGRRGDGESLGRRRQIAEHQPHLAGVDEAGFQGREHGLVPSGAVRAGERGVFDHRDRRVGPAENAVLGLDDRKRRPRLFGRGLRPCRRRGEHQEAKRDQNGTNGHGLSPPAGGRWRRTAPPAMNWRSCRH